MNSASYNSDCNGEKRWDGDGDGADDDDGDDDLDDARDDGDDDEDDLPPPGEVLPGGICPPERPFFLCRFPPRSGGGTPETLLVLGFLGHEGHIGQRGAPGVGPTTQAARWRGLGGGAPPGRLDPWWPPSGCPSASLRDFFGNFSPVNFSSFGDVLI